jgi:hypothetical protein
MTADPGPIVGGGTVTIDYSGDAVFLKNPLLDAGFNLLGGFTRASADLIRVDTEARSGLTTIPPVASLTINPAAVDEITCQFGGQDCSVNGNADCPLAIAGDFCGNWINVPTSDQCDANLGGDGTCNDACNPTTGFCVTTYGATGGAQCSATGGAFPGLGYCLTADLPISLSSDTGSYTAAANGTVRLGWAENGQNGFPAAYTPNGLCPSTNACAPAGSYAIPGSPAPGSQPITINVSVAPPTGSKIGRTPVGIQCLQGRQPDPNLEVSFPLLDAQLIDFNIQVP